MSNDDQREQRSFPHAELYFLLLSTIVAAPLAKSGWDALIVSDYVRGALSLMAATGALALGFSFKYWQSHLAAPTRRIIREIVSNRAMVAAVCLIFLAYCFVVVPDLTNKTKTATQDYPAEITNLKDQLKTANDRIASLGSELLTAKKELEALGGRPTTSLSDPTLRLSELDELGKALGMYADLIFDGEQLRSEKVPALENGVSPQALAQLTYRLTNRAAATNDRISQIFEKYKMFPDITTSLGSPPNLQNSSNELAALVGSLDVSQRLNINREVYNQAAYQSFSDALKSTSAWSQEAESKIKNMRQKYEAALASGK